MRGALIEAIGRAPLSALILYFWKKPLAILSVLDGVFLGATPLYWLWCLLASGVGGSLIFLAWGLQIRP